jgi:hypothetical protein
MNLVRRALIVFLSATLTLGFAAPPTLAQGLGGPKIRVIETAADGRALVGYPGQNAKLMEGKDTIWSRWKVGEKEYFAQPNDWTCSASCYIMMFRTLVRADISVNQAIERCGAVEGVGADNSQVVKAFQLLGSRFQVVSGQSSQSSDNLPADAPELLREKEAELATLKRLLQDGYLVMINFREPQEQIGHYGVLQGLNDRALEIADPYYGRRSVLSLDRFDYRSGFSQPILHGWYLAVRPTTGQR